MKQRQFLDVVTDDEAHRRIDEATADLEPQAETVVLDEALGRVLMNEVRAAVDVPAFDRSDRDGFAIVARDVAGASELAPVRLRLADSALGAGVVAKGATAVASGTAVPIATGAVIPRGADAVVMIEDTRLAADDGRIVEVHRGLAPGANISAAGSDIGRGDVILRRGTLLGSRETALAAAVGSAEVIVHRRPSVVVFSTGNEVVTPGAPLELGQVHDANARALIDAARECGATASFGGIVVDDVDRVAAALRARLDSPKPPDLVLFSGGTSKGEGDLVADAVRRVGAASRDGADLIVHGVALKPGKPFGFGRLGCVLVALLPGFPTSAIFTFHEFVAPILRRLAGVRALSRGATRAVLPRRLRSSPGRTEYVLVDLVSGRDGLVAYPLGAGSGSVSTFSAADGWFRIGRQVECVEAGESVDVMTFASQAKPCDLIAIGSHCIGLDALLSLVADEGFSVKSIHIGSEGGLAALARGEGDVAGSHLLCPSTGLYNRPFLPPDTSILGGWKRRQGVVFRAGDTRFEGKDLDRIAALVHGRGVRMVNRNPGSGTRHLLDAFLGRYGAAGSPRPEGFHAQARSHHAVAAAVAQGRADWGVTLDILAASAGLSFVPLAEERYDLVVRDECRERPGVELLARILDGKGRDLLIELGFE